MLKKIVASLVSLGITVLLVREFFFSIPFDYATSVVPGWHITIYPDKLSWFHAFLVVGLSLLVGMAFFIIRGLIIKLWDRLAGGE